MIARLFLSAVEALSCLRYAWFWVLLLLPGAVSLGISRLLSGSSLLFGPSMAEFVDFKINQLVDSSETLGIFLGQYPDLFGLAKTIITYLTTSFFSFVCALLLAIVMISLFLMPVIVRHVISLPGYQAFTPLNRKGAISAFFSSSLSSFGNTLTMLGIFFLATFPLLILYFIPVIGQILVPLLLILLSAVLLYRTMAYDALSTYASIEERVLIFRQHRYALLFIGIIGSILGAVSYQLWLIALFSPFFGFIVLSLLMLNFILTAAWFGFYCFRALRELRGVL